MGRTPPSLLALATCPPVSNGISHSSAQPETAPGHDYFGQTWIWINRLALPPPMGRDMTILP